MLTLATSSRQDKGTPGNGTPGSGSGHATSSCQAVTLATAHGHAGSSDGATSSNGEGLAPSRGDAVQALGLDQAGQRLTALLAGVPLATARRAVTKTRPGNGSKGKTHCAQIWHRSQSHGNAQGRPGNGRGKGCR